MICLVILIVVKLVTSFHIVISSSLGGRSHIKPILEISEVLTQRGHSITYVSIETNLRFAQGYNVSQVSLGRPSSTILNRIKELYAPPRDADPDHLFEIVPKMISDVYDLEFPSFDVYLNRTPVDLIVCDFGAGSCQALAMKYGIPMVVGIQTTDTMGLTRAPYLTPSLSYGPLTTENLSFLERFNAMIYEPFKKILKERRIQQLTRKKQLQYGIDIKSSGFINKNYALRLANTYVGFEVALPQDPTLEMVGPIISEQHNTKLPAQIQTFLNNHPRTIYVAFGSNLQLEKEDIKLIIDSTLLAISNDIIDGVLWGLGKTSRNDFPNQLPSSILLLDWAPQPAILSHTNTKVFISHGGMESSIEAIHSGTPILCMAHLGDQPRNAAKLEAAGVGMYVNRLTATSDSLMNQIDSIINNPKIQVHVKRMQTISHYQSQQINRAADLIEMHGQLAKLCRPDMPYIPFEDKPPCELQHRVSVASRQPWYRAYLIDVILVGLVTLFVAFCCLLYVLRYFFLLSRPHYKSD